MQFARSHPIHLAGIIAALAVIIAASVLYYERVCASTCAWTEQTGAGMRNWVAIAMSADGQKIAAVPDSGYVYTSADGGVTWSERSALGVHGWRDVALSSDGTRMAVGGTEGALWISSDSGENWSPIDTGDTKTWQHVAVSGDGTRLAGFTSDGWIWTQPYGTEFVPPVSEFTEIPLHRAEMSVSADGTRMVLAIEGQAIYVSETSGVYWVDMVTSGPRDWQSVALSADGLTIAALERSGNVHFSYDFGTSWHPNISITSTTWSKISLSPDGMHAAMAADGGSIYTSDDAGETWTEQVGAGTHAWSSVAVSGDGTRLAASVYGGPIYTGLVDAAPDRPADLGPAALVSGLPTNASRPAFTFTLADADPADQVGYQILIATSLDFAAPVIDYTSGLGSTGGVSYTVGQAAGLGTYTVGSSDSVLSDGPYYWKVRAFDAAGAFSSYAVAASSGMGLAFVVDTVAPVIAEVSPISSYTYDHTPTFVFSSTEAGAINYDGGCVSSTARAAIGNTEVTFDYLASGAYDCSISVIDDAGNISNILAVRFSTGTAGGSGGGSSGGGSGAVSAETNYVALSQAEPPPPADIEPVSTTPRFAKVLRPGMRDPAVRELQAYLNTHGFPVALTGPGSRGSETVFYGTATQKAVKALQEAYAAQILTPAGLNTGTGIFGPATAAYANAHP